MFKLRPTKFVIGVACAMFAVWLAFPAGAIAQQDDDDSSGETAAEMLVDGMDAAADHAIESARHLFQKLIAAFPGSPEALKAKRALATLGQDKDTIAAARAAFLADEADRSAQYRRAFLIDIGDRVFFPENSATIGGRARSMIENQARWLKAHPGLNVTIIGRADDGGDQQAADALAMARAETVRDRLIAAGLEAKRIGIRSVGNQDRVAVCGSPLCKAENRTAEVYINNLQEEGNWWSQGSSASARPEPTIGSRRAPNKAGQVAQ
jgi:peptidoglycan-associated lipoprotein